YVRGTSQSF
ncbi:hypothetical protein D047_0742B, partial [Vibrio parahaemolyticus VPTS-2010_2]